MPSQFSRPDRRPYYVQSTDTMFRYAGQTATWKQYISATSGVAVAGEGTTFHYRQSTITAIFGRGFPATFLELQAGAGLQAAGVTYMTTREKLDRRDEIVWRGTAYRVESDPVLSRMAGFYFTQLKRGEG